MKNPLALSLAIVVGCFSSLCLSDPSKDGNNDEMAVLSVAEGIESVRAVTDANSRSIFQSPDGLRYVTVFIRGDLQADGVWAELMYGQVIFGAEAKPRSIARFFTRGLGPSSGFALYGATALTMPQSNAPVWLDNSRVGLLWEDTNGVIQVVSVDVTTGRTKFITHSDTDVLGFTMSSSGALLYEALARVTKEHSEALLHDGFSVIGADALPMVAGYVDGTSMFDFMNCDRFLVAPGSVSAVKIRLASPFHCGSGSIVSRQVEESSPLFSPDGNHILINASVRHVPAEWAEYKNLSLKAAIQQHQENPKGLSARLLQQLVLVDVRDGSSRVLWQAPYNTAEELRIAWSPDGSSMLLSPTFMPRDCASSEGLVGNAVSEVDLESGRGFALPAPPNISTRIRSMRLVSRDSAEVYTDDGRTLVYRKGRNEWRLVKSLVEPHRAPTPQSAGKSKPLISIKQDLNSPPVLYSSDPQSGNDTVLVDLNPFLRKKLLGKVDFISWEDRDRRKWKGRLYHPVPYDRTRKYPVVIQARCSADESEFSIYGCGGQHPALGPGWSVFLAQVLAGEGIAVLQISAPANGFEYDSSKSTSPLEWTIQRTLEAGWTAAAEHLVNTGIADPDAVGLMGFSLTGWVVEYALTQSDFPFAAAIASDHGTMGYLQAALNGWPVGPSNAAGGAPFGEGLEAWRRNAPVFNVEKIFTPLQLQQTSSAEGLTNLLWQWEMFSRLRYLRKPVEYYVAPNVTRGSHTLQNPRQLLILQTRALDWWRFWLKNEEIPDSKREDQYKAWRQLRKLHEADLENCEVVLCRSPRFR